MLRPSCVKGSWSPGGEEKEKEIYGAREFQVFVALHV